MCALCLLLPSLVLVVAVRLADQKYRLRQTKGVLNLMPLLSLPTSNAPALVTAHDSTLIDALRVLVQFSPSLSFWMWFVSSTRFIECISERKHPRSYAMYRSHVAMLIPVLTPVWGTLLSLLGMKSKVEELVWGVLVRRKLRTRQRRSELFLFVFNSSYGHWHHIGGHIHQSSVKK